MKSKKNKLTLVLIVLIVITALLVVLVHGNNKYQTGVSRIIQRMDIVENIEDDEWKTIDFHKISEKIGNCYIEGISDNGRYVAYIDKKADSFIDRDEFIVFDLENNAKVQSYNFRKRKELVDMVYLDNEGKYFYVKTTSKEFSLEEKIPNKLYYVNLNDENKNMKVLAEEFMGYCKIVNDEKNIIFNGNINDKVGIFSFDIKTKEINLIEEEASIAEISHDNKRILIVKIDNYEKDSPLGFADADVKYYVGKLEGTEIKNINFLYKLNSYEEIDIPGYAEAWSNDNKKVAISILDNRSEKYLHYVFTLKEF